jgi:DNA-binding MarR family transcriptional regulator
MVAESCQSAEITDLLERLTQFQRSCQQGDGLNPAQWTALRYLAKANRYSRNATALTAFLGSTKGTISQTLNALERKRLIARRPDPRDGRAFTIELTAAGQDQLGRDPLSDMTAAVAELFPVAQQGLRDHLTDLLTGLQKRNGRQAFGICHTCRFFRRNAAVGETGGPHRCGLTQEPLADTDIGLICAEHQHAA